MKTFDFYGLPLPFQNSTYANRFEPPPALLSSEFYNSKKIYILTALIFFDTSTRAMKFTEKEHRMGKVKRVHLNLARHTD